MAKLLAWLFSLIISFVTYLFLLVKGFGIEVQSWNWVVGCWVVTFINTICVILLGREE